MTRVDPDGFNGLGDLRNEHLQARTTNPGEKETSQASIWSV